MNEFVNKHLVLLILCSWSLVSGTQSITTAADFIFVLSQVIEKTVDGEPFSGDTVDKLAQLIEALENEQVILEEQDKHEILPLLLELARQCEEDCGEDGDVVDDELLTRKKLKKVACLLVQQKLLANNLRVCNNAVFKNIILKENPVHGTRDITIVAPDDVLDDYTLILPATAGYAGQVLSTDGAGLLSWITTVTNAFELQLLSTATSNNVPNTLVLRDNLGSFSAQDISAEGNFLLPTTTADVGQLKINNTPVLHTYGTANTFVGENAGNFTLSSNSSVGIGFNALQSLVSGSSNIGIGDSALQSLTSGGGNLAIGHNALSNNTVGSTNIAVGNSALFSLAAGSVNNVAIGEGAMYSHQNGNSNIAIGSNALGNNTLGNNCIAIGLDALSSNTTGVNNVAIGSNALASNGTGSNSVAIGNDALTQVGLSSQNIAIGDGAASGITTGIQNVVIGGSALTSAFTGNNNVYIGFNVAGIPASESNRIRIGSGENVYDSGNGSRCYLRFLGATAAASTVTYNTGDGQLAVVTSSEQYKDNIQDMADSTENLSLLRPVTFTYKPEYVGSADAIKKQYGLIAEEVATVYPELVSYNAAGQPESVIYQFLAPMLLNEYIKQKQYIAQLFVTEESQSDLIHQLQTRIESLEDIIH